LIVILGSSRKDKGGIDLIIILHHTEHVQQFYSPSAHAQTVVFLLFLYKNGEFLIAKSYQHSKLTMALRLGAQRLLSNLRAKSLHVSAIPRNQPKFNQPQSGYDMPRSGGIATTFRLPLAENKPEGLDACFVGIPMDNGVSGRTGTRMAPRQIRNESTIIRSVNMTGAAPFESIQVADIGDVPVVPFNLKKTLTRIPDHFRRIVDAGCIPITMGGDHTLTYPILQAMKEKYGKVAMIQVDAHTDLYDNMMGEKLAHSTPFRRAIEEDLLSVEHVYQIGLRGSMYSLDEYSEVYEWAQNLVSKLTVAIALYLDYTHICAILIGTEFAGSQDGVCR